MVPVVKVVAAAVLAVIVVFIFRSSQCGSGRRRRRLYVVAVDIVIVVAATGSRNGTRSNSADNDADGMRPSQKAQTMSKEEPRHLDPYTLKEVGPRRLRPHESSDQKEDRKEDPLASTSRTVGMRMN